MLAQIKSNVDLFALVSSKKEDLFELESQDFVAPFLPRMVRNSSGQLSVRSVSLLEALASFPRGWLEVSSQPFFTALSFYLGKEEMSAETFRSLARALLRADNWSYLVNLTELHLKNFDYQGQFLRMSPWKQELMSPEGISALYLSALKGDCKTFYRVIDEGFFFEVLYEDLTTLLGVSLIEVIYMGGFEELILWVAETGLLQLKGNVCGLAPLVYYEIFSPICITSQLIESGVEFPSGEIYREFPLRSPVETVIYKIFGEKELLSAVEKLIKAGTSTEGVLLCVCRLKKTFLLPALADSGFILGPEVLRSLLLTRELVSVYQHNHQQTFRQVFSVSADFLVSALARFDLLALALALPHEEVVFFESDPDVRQRWNLVKGLLAAKVAPLERRAVSVVWKALVEAYYRPSGRGFLAAKMDFEKRLGERNYVREEVKI